MAFAEAILTYAQVCFRENWSDFYPILNHPGHFRQYLACHFLREKNTEFRKALRMLEDFSLLSNLYMRHGSCYIKTRCLGKPKQLLFLFLTLP